MPVSSAPPVYATKQHAVYLALRAQIIQGSLAPGESLRIATLAEQFHVSIIPVREALRQLASERLVEIQPHTGVRVTDVRREDVEEIFALLSALESASAAPAVEALKPTHLKSLRKILDDLDKAAEKHDEAAFEEANKAFHLLPSQICGFTRVEEALHRVFSDWERIHRLACRGTKPPDMVRANRDHRVIAEALEQKNVAALVAAIGAHNQVALAKYRADGINDIPGEGASNAESSATAV